MLVRALSGLWIVKLHIAIILNLKRKIPVFSVIDKNVSLNRHS